MKIQASFLQRFRGLNDGAAFDKVFSGTTPALTFNYTTLQYETDSTAVQNWGGTVTLSIREYNESEGFSTLESNTLPDVYFFTGLPSTIPGSYEGSLPVAKWNIKAGSAPIRWTISDQINKVAQDPRFAGYDVVGAVKRGVENWNLVFGFKALEAVVGTPADSQGDDDKNVLVVDTDPSLSFAFADARVNPNTGEIRGASVYFNTGWFDLADMIFEDDVSAPAAASAETAAKLKKFLKPGASLDTRRLAALAKSSPASLSRLGAFAAQRLAERGPRLGAHSGTGSHLCEMSIAALAEHAQADTNAALTKKEKVERFITHVILHEVGHTLGLRHNFKGSLVPPTSSVMEYVDDQDAVYADVPGAYDHQAIKYLYGLSTELPTLPFCNDSGVFPADASLTDPLCLPFDRGVDPLNENYGPRFAAFAKNYLENPDVQSWEINFALFDIYSIQNYLFGEQVAHTDRMKALEYLSGALAQANPQMLATVPDYYQRVDAMVDFVYNTMFSGAPAIRPYGILLWKPTPTDTEMTKTIVAHLKAIVLDEKKLLDRAEDSMFIRPTAIRWAMKSYQIGAARQALVELDAELAAKALIDPTEAGRTSELRAVISNTINPYFW